MSVPISAHHPLRVYRFENQITLEELAQKLEVDASTLSRIEQRQLRPSMALAERIAHTTGGRVMPNDFIDPPKPTKEKGSKRKRG